MKLILSRKGFDSVYGRIPNAIMPDGRLCWFPIPSGHGKIRYGDLRFGPLRLSDLIYDLSRGGISAADKCHLDPDIAFSYLARPRGWRPCFGQVGIAQAHLHGHGIAQGDVFLFFGWFRRIEKSCRGYWSYVPMQPDLHIIFGWLQVGRVFDVNRDRKSIPGGCRGHAHVIDRAGYKNSINNTIYIASKKFEFPGIYSSFPGGGMFPRYQKTLQLTAKGKTRGVWLLPYWAFPDMAKAPLSYHSDMTRWRKTGSGVLLRTVGRGQEFILDMDHYPEAEGWVRSLFKS